MDEWHWAEISLNAIVTLGAAFAGAYFAFLFEKSNRDKERVADEVASGNRALFTLTCMWNKLLQYHREMIAEYAGREDAWLNLPAGTSLKDATLTFDMKDLSFVLLKAPGIFQNIFLEEARFHNLAELVDRRDGVIMDEVFTRLSAAGLQLGEQRPIRDIENLLGVGVTQQLKVTTAAIIKNIAEDMGAWLGGLGRLTVFFTTFVAKVTAFLRLFLAGWGLPMLEGFFLHVSSCFLNFTFNAHLIAPMFGLACVELIEMP